MNECECYLKNDFVCHFMKNVTNDIVLCNDSDYLYDFFDHDSNISARLFDSSECTDSGLRSQDVNSHYDKFNKRKNFEIVANRIEIDSENCESIIHEKDLDKLELLQLDILHTDKVYAEVEGNT